jgi:hypothetical protein
MLIIHRLPALSLLEYPVLPAAHPTGLAFCRQQEFVYYDLQHLRMSIQTQFEFLKHAFLSPSRSIARQSLIAPFRPQQPWVK